MFYRTCFFKSEWRDVVEKIFLDAINVVHRELRPNGKLGFLWTIHCTNNINSASSYLPGLSFLFTSQLQVLKALALFHHK